MRISFTRPQFLPRWRLDTFRHHNYPSRLILTPLIANHLSASATKRHLSNSRLDNQPSSVSDSKTFTPLHDASDDEYTPRPLSRPLGQLQPPQPGENTGVDPRSWRERRDEFWDYDKHLARRQQLYVFALTRLIQSQASSWETGQVIETPNFLITISVPKGHYNVQTVFP